MLGIGNLLLRDEGVGVHAARALRERYVFPPGVKIIDGGTMGLDLLPFIEGYDHLLIVDAVDFRAEPGAIQVIEDGDIRKFLDIKFSMHQVGLPDMLFAASLAGMAPPRICLVGIQPHIIDTGLELSDALKERFGDLMDAVMEKLASWGLEVKERADVPCDSVQNS